MGCNMISIRRIQKHQVPLYRTIRLNALRNDQDAFETRYEDAIKRTESYWEDLVYAFAESSEKCCFIAFDDEKPIGLISFYKYENESAGEIIQVWINKDYRGLGIIQQLMDGIFLWIKNHGISSVYAYVKETNLRAIKCYANYGFMRTDRQKNDEIQMLYSY